MINIGPVAPSDANAISSLIASFSDEFLSGDKAHAVSFFELTSAAAEKGYICSPRYIFVKATYQGNLIGFAAVRDQTHLFHLFVQRIRQREGLGTKLWQQVRERALFSGSKGEFTVNSAPKSICFYEKLGFKAVSEMVEENGVTYIPMRMTL